MQLVATELWQISINNYYRINIIDITKHRKDVESVCFNAHSNILTPSNNSMTPGYLACYILRDA